MSRHALVVSVSQFGKSAPEVMGVDYAEIAKVTKQTIFVQAHRAYRTKLARDTHIVRYFDTKEEALAELKEIERQTGEAEVDRLKDAVKAAHQRRKQLRTALLLDPDMGFRDAGES